MPISALYFSEGHLSKTNPTVIVNHFENYLSQERHWSRLQQWQAIEYQQFLLYGFGFFTCLSIEFIFRKVKKPRLCATLANMPSQHSLSQLISIWKKIGHTIPSIWKFVPVRSSIDIALRPWTPEYRSNFFHASCMIGRRLPWQLAFWTLIPETEVLENLNCSEFSVQRVEVEARDFLTAQQLVTQVGTEVDTKLANSFVVILKWMDGIKNLLWNVKFWEFRNVYKWCMCL